MLIRDLSREECLKVLAGTQLARLACAHDNQPYIVPVYIVYSETSGFLYGFTTPGQKVEWMRANPLVCVEVDQVNGNDQWVSVVATGRYEELPDAAGSDAANLHAKERQREMHETISPWSEIDPNQQRPEEGCKDVRCNEERDRAWQILKTRPMWWEPGCATWKTRVHGAPDEQFVSVYYRIRIDQVTGRKATKNTRETIPNAKTVPPKARRWGIGSILSGLWPGWRKRPGSAP